MDTIPAFYKSFESLCMRILEGNGFIAEQAATTWPESWLRSVDIAIRENTRTQDAKFIRLVEVKWTSQPDISLERLRNWAAQTAALRSDQLEKPLLISSGRIEESRRLWAETTFNIEIWDRDHLIKLASEPNRKLS